MMSARLNQRIGALYGIALGDAMGMPSEGMHPEEIKSTFGRIDRLLCAPAVLPPRMVELEKSTRTMQMGEVTDDTELSILVTEMLIAHHGKVDMRDFIARLQAWADRYAEKATSVCGPSTKRALAALKAGTPPEIAGRYGDSNGSIMKIIPIGLVNDYHDLAHLVEQVYQLCLPTHGTSLAVAGAAAITAAVSYAVYCGCFRWEEAWNLAIQASELGAQKARWCWGRTVRCALIRTKQVMDALMADKADEDRVLRVLFEDIGTGLPCAETACAALAIAYYSGGDPHYAAVLGANVGADTDTIASIAAGLCGAIRGISAIPEADRALLSQANRFDFEALARGLDAVAQ